MAVPQVLKGTVSLVVSLAGRTECFSPVTHIGGYPWRLQLVKKHNGKCELYVLCEMSGKCEYWETDITYAVLKDPPQHNTFIFGSMEENKKQLIGEFLLFADGTRLEVEVEPSVSGDQWVRRPVLSPFAPRDGCLLIEDKKIFVNKESLASQSSFFERLFNGDFKEKNMAEIPIGDVGYEEFLNLLRMMYGENGASVISDLLTHENVHRVLQLVDRFDFKSIRLGIANTLVNQYSIFSIHERLLIADQYVFPEWCKEEIYSQYYDDQLVELKEVMKSPEYRVISSQTKDALFEKTCDALKNAKNTIDQLKKRPA